MSLTANFIDSTVSFSNQALNGALEALKTAGAQVLQIDPPRIDVQEVQLGAVPAPPDLEWQLPFEYQAMDLQLKPMPQQQHTLLELGDINIGLAPVLDAQTPVLQMPDKPLPLEAFQGTAPAIHTSVDFPEPPAELSLDVVAPELTQFAAPDKPTVLLPVFDGQRPVDDMGAAPRNLDAAMIERWRELSPAMAATIDEQVDAWITEINPQFKQQMGAIETQLARYLEGGTGLNPEVEDAIYERARDKVHAEARRVQQSVWADAANRGFTLPNGVLTATALAARQAAADNQARAALDIAIKQAEMEQQNLQWAVAQSTALRGTVMNAALAFHANQIQINGQALQAAQQAVALVVECFNAQVRAYGARLDAYKTDAAIFETRLRGAMAAIELYKAEIDALQAMAQVDQAKINAYRAKIESISILANVYRTRIEAVKTRAEMEKLKLDLFGMQVQTYVAQTQAKNSEWQAYSAAMSGEEAKVRVHGQQVQAFNATMSGYKTGIEAQAEAVKARSLANQAALEQYKAAISAWSTEASARADIAKIAAADASMRLSFHQAGLSQQLQTYQLQMEAYKANADANIKTVEFNLKAVVAAAEMVHGHKTIVSNMAAANANAYTGVAKAALSGMTTVVGMTEEAPTIGGGA